MSAPSLAAAPAVFELGLRVYWEDTDAGGIVFYANYLKFFERARTEWLRSKGHGQEALRRDAGLMFVVAHTAVNYRAPARLDDWLLVDVQVTASARASLTLAQQAWRLEPDGQRTRLADGSIRIGCVDVVRHRPHRIPPELLQALS